MGSLRVHPKDGVEDLHGRVGVESGNDLGEAGQIAVDELTKPSIVFHRSQSAGTGHKQLKAGNAKGVLHINEQQAHPHPIRLCRRDPLLLGPELGFCCPLLVGHAPNLSHPLRIKVGGKARWSLNS
jgi:hypothetical protein